jgi:P-type E1-E2 ATPase
VVGDVVKLSLGAVVVADVRLTDGSILLDQSMLTGESIPAEAATGALAYAGGLVRRGEALAEVTATAERTKFGRTAELVRTAKVESSEQKIVMRVVRNLALFNGAATILLAAYAYFLPMPVAEIVPLVLVGILSSISRGAAVHVHACRGGRRTVVGGPGRPADESLRSGRSSGRRCPVFGQDRHPDAQRAYGDGRPSYARLR